MLHGTQVPLFALLLVQYIWLPIEASTGPRIPLQQQYQCGLHSIPSQGGFPCTHHDISSAIRGSPSVSRWPLCTSLQRRTIRCRHGTTARPRVPFLTSYNVSPRQAAKTLCLSRSVSPPLITTARCGPNNPCISSSPLLSTASK